MERISKRDSLKDKDLMTAEDYKDKRIIDLYKQIRTINRRIKIESNKNKSLEKESLVKDNLNNLNNKQSSSDRDNKHKPFIDSNQPLDNEAKQLKNRYNKLSNELSLIRMEFSSMKSL